MEFWKILLDDIKEPVSYLPMGVGAAIMMLLLLRLVNLDFCFILRS